MSMTTESLAPPVHKALAGGRKAAAETWDRVAARGSELREGAVSAATQWADRTRGYVEHRPWRALLLAAAVGAAAAVLVEWFARDRRWR